MFNQENTLWQISVCSQPKFTKYLAHEQASLTMLQERFLRPEEDYFETSGGEGRFAEDLALKGGGRNTLIKLS